MKGYIGRRVLLIIPTLFGIMLLNFLVVQILPGGPVEKVLAQLTDQDASATARVTQAQGEQASGRSVANVGATGQSRYRGARGIDPDLVAELEKQFGFDQPAYQRFFTMLWKYVRFDFGESFYQGKRVTTLIVERMPVSISLGVWSTLIIYLVSIPLGIVKAVRNGSRFDLISSFLLFIANAIPSFLFAILLIVFFAGGEFFAWFPLRGLTSDHWETMTWVQKSVDYLWHLVLPVTALVIGSFASLAMLTKNSFMDEIQKQYVMTARAKGLSRHRVLFGHVFRNAMLIVIAGFPALLVGILFTGAMLTEIIFSLDGLGLLGFESVVNRDYPVVFGTLYMFSLLGLLLNLMGDLMYVWIDPRIDFDRRVG
jgi:microcin C transport system permease protein